MADDGVTRRCDSLRTNGEKCKAFAIHGDTKCLFHTDRSGPRRVLKNRPPISTEELVGILSREIRRLSLNKKVDPIERGREIRNLAALLAELQGGKVSEPEAEKTTLDQRLEQWKKKAVPQSSKS